MKSLKIQVLEMHMRIKNIFGHVSDIDLLLLLFFYILWYEV
jgi:hypothetical protein